MAHPNHGRFTAGAVLAMCALSSLRPATAAAKATVVIVSVNGTTFNTTFTEDDVIDSPGKKPTHLEGGCTADACHTSCRQKMHAAGRCEQDQCICRDLKERGRCTMLLNFGCGGGCDGGCGTSGTIINNNNNNNVIVVKGRGDGPTTGRQVADAVSADVKAKPAVDSAGAEVRGKQAVDSAAATAAGAPKGKPDSSTQATDGITVVLEN